MRRILIICGAFLLGSLSMAAGISGAAMLTGHPLSDFGATVTIVLAFFAGVTLADMVPTTGAF